MKWISVEDKKPKDDQTVFVWQEKQYAHIPCICYYEEEEDCFVALYSAQDIKVTAKYWLPLPEPPKDKE